MSAVAKFLVHLPGEGEWRDWRAGERSLWPHHRNPRDLLHKVANLHPYRTSQCRNMKSYMNSWLRCYYFRFGKRKKNKRPPYWDSTSDFNFRYITAIGMLFCISLPNSSKGDHVGLQHDIIFIFQDGGRGRSILLPVSYLLMLLPSKGQSLSPNEICRHISIHGCDITTSIFEK